MPNPIPSKNYILVIDADRSKILKGAINTLLQNQFTNQVFSAALMQMGLVEHFKAFSQEIMDKEHLAGLCYDPNCPHISHKTT